MRREHDEAAIGGYLAGDLSRDEVEEVEAHLLACDRCWGEVEAGREGRTLAEQAREPLPPGLRDRILAVVGAEDPGLPSHRRRMRVPLRLVPRPRRWVALAAGAAVLLASIAVTIESTRGDPTSPAQIAAAVADYQADTLPGPAIPASSGPDLSALRMSLAGAGDGELAGQAVTGYGYRDSTGRRVIVYYSDKPFPMPVGAGADPADAALEVHDGVSVLCSRAPHTILVLSDDGKLVEEVAALLDLV